MSGRPTESARIADFWSRVGPELSWLHVQLRRLGVPDADVDDVSQQLLVAVYERWDRYDQARPVRPWLFGFAYRLASGHRRRARPHLSGEFTEHVADDAPSTEERIIAMSRRALLAAALDDLDVAKRAIITLVDLEEMPVPEAAAILEIPLNTGYSRLRTARQELAAAVRRRSGGES